MSSFRWLVGLACLATLAAGPAGATDPSLGEPVAGTYDPSAVEASAADSTQAEDPGQSIEYVPVPAVADEPEQAQSDPSDPELAQPEQTEQEQTETENQGPVRGASFGGSPQHALETVTGALGKPQAKEAGSEPAAAPEEAQEGPIGAIPSIKESLQVGDALDDLLLFPEPYYYQGTGRRDIFVSLLEEDDGADPDLKSADLTVVGILWAEHDRFALVETPEGRALILREGSALGDGTVVRILPDRVIVHVTEFGTSRNVSLPLAQGGLNDENPRSRRR
jgi:hypothetical protein